MRNLTSSTLFVASFWPNNQFTGGGVASDHHSKATFQIYLEDMEMEQIQ